MKVNGTRYKVYTERLGPYDAYYYKGNFVTELPTNSKVKKAFDMDGDHIGIVRHHIPVQFWLVTLLLILICGIGCVVYFLQPVHADCIVYMPEKPHRIDATTISLKIKNKNPNPLYIIVGDVKYQLEPDAYIDTVEDTGSTEIILMYADLYYVEALE